MVFLSLATQFIVHFLTPAPAASILNYWLRILLKVYSSLYHLQVCFEVSILEKLPVTMPETETNPHVVRVGWSVDKANLQVGMIA